MAYLNRDRISLSRLIRRAAIEAIEVIYVTATRGYRGLFGTPASPGPGEARNHGRHPHLAFVAQPQTSEGDRPHPEYDNTYFRHGGLLPVPSSERCAIKIPRWFVQTTRYRYFLR